MTQALDAYDVRLARGATGLLRTFNDAGVLDAADVHVANRLGELGGESDERVRLAVALAVRAVRHGSVCIDLADVPRIAPDLDWPAPAGWAEATAASPLVGAGRPLSWDSGMLYLERYWRQEDQVCADLLGREAQPSPPVDSDRLAAGLDRLFPEGGDQRNAAERVAMRWTTVLGGGPGTGKTTTIARVLALLLDQPGPRLRVALGAPTGKAAARLQEAVQHETSHLPDPVDRERVGPMVASTIHRLLGFRAGGGERFRHDRDNRLPHDLVVIDETSMVSLTLMARLLEALRPDARLVLVGDPDQLASVEAGAVLADVAAGLSAREGAASNQSDRSVVLLRHTWRFGGAIAELAAAIREGRADDALAILSRGAGGVSFSGEVSSKGDASSSRDPLSRSDASFKSDDIRADVVAAAAAMRSAAQDGDAAAALHHLAEHRLLCAHRSGPFGVDSWSRDIEHWLAEDLTEAPEGEWYAGRPLLVTANDYALGLFNGDTGVVVRGPDASLRAVFPRGSGLATISPARLTDVQTVHAMTVHRSQGSQFSQVSLVLPPEDSPLLTRELLYTAITRAQSRVRVLGSEAAVRIAIEHPAARASGLRERLAGRNGNEA